MGGGFRFGGMGMGTATSSTISNGTLIVDFYAAATKQAGLAREGYKDSKPEQQSAKEPEEHAERHQEVAEEFSSPVQVIGQTTHVKWDGCIEGCHPVLTSIDQV